MFVIFLTSNEYNQQINSSLRNYSYVKVMFGISQEDVPTISNFSDNGHLPYSNVSELDLGIDVFKTYETLERNRFRLDGKNLLPSKSNPLYQGYVGSSISNSNGVFTGTRPKITVTFPKLVVLNGITLAFDNTKFEYVKKLTIKTYNGNSLVENLTSTPQITDFPMLIVNKTFQLCNKIEIEMLETFPSYRRPRISSILFGIMKIITETEIVNCEFKSKGELVSTSLPQNDFTFTVFDTTNSYDIDNPNNIHNYLESGQPVSFLIGYQLDSGDIEWIPMSKTYTTGKVTVSGTRNLAQLTFDCTSILDKFNVIYDEVKFRETTLYDLAKDIARFVGYPNALDLDDELKNFRTNIPLPRLSARECLQLIANAGMCTMTINRAGQIVIKREYKISLENNFDLNFSNMLSEPKTNKIPFIKNLISGYNVNLIENEYSELLKTSITTSGEEKDIILEYENSQNHRYTVSSGLRVIGSPKFYCGAVKLRLIGTGEIIITGQKITQNTIKHISDFNQEGTDLEVYNILVNDELWLLQYINYLYRYYSRRVDYSMETRGYPQLDVLDKIELENNYNDMVNVTVLEQNLSYNGALKGSNKFLSNNRSVLYGKDQGYWYRETE